ncbi:MAG: PhzF family phenazine biosynthesis protein [Sphingomonas sp.]|nr:PhzF family phenazine biosynthesis protein [Sphingomonas sp.]
MPHCNFSMVDVFGDGLFAGNPLAVIAGGIDLDTTEMQRIAHWLNLSETTFLLPPTEAGADYRVRIFTVDRELPFAGHPTLGSAHAWLEQGGTPKTEGVVVQQCGAGLVTLRRDGDRLAFAAPPRTRSGPLTGEELDEVIGVLRIGRDQVVDAQWVSNGPGWVAVLMESAEAVLAVEPVAAHDRIIDIGVVGPHRGGDADFEIRGLFSTARGTLIEDPVTGSLNASVAQWLFESGRAKGNYVAAQGTKLGRRGRVHLSQDAGGQVWVAGTTRTLMSGAGLF